MTERSWRMCLASLCMSYFSSGVVITLILASFPNLREEFNAGAHSGWIVTAYLLVSATSAALFGRLGDLLGRKKLLVIALSIIFFGGLISAFSPSFWILVLGTALQGLAGAIIPLCVGLARQHGPAERLPSTIGIIIAGGMVGACFGLFLGGLIVDLSGWEMVFIAGILIVFLTLAMVISFVPTSKENLPGVLDGFDYWGVILFIPGITGILYAVSQASITGWRDPGMLTILVISLAIQGIWVWHELRFENPLINVRLLMNRQVLLANLCMACVAFGTVQVGQIMTMYFRQPLWTLAGFGISATITGLLLGPLNLVGVFSSPWAGRLAERFNLRIAMIISVFIILFAWVCIVVWSESLLMVMVALLINAVGLTAAYTIIPSLIVDVVPSERTSEATGLMVTTRAVFQAAGAQVMVLILSSQTISDGASATSYFSNTGFMAVFYLILALSFLCFILAAALPSRIRPA